MLDYYVRALFLLNRKKLSVEVNTGISILHSTVQSIFSLELFFFHSLKTFKLVHVVGQVRDRYLDVLEVGAVPAVRQGRAASLPVLQEGDGPQRHEDTEKHGAPVVKQETCLKRIRWLVRERPGSGSCLVFHIFRLVGKIHSGCRSTGGCTCVL